MNPITTLSILALLSTSAAAQCFETNYGTLLGTGDDTLFATQPMNISFPMGGTFATYDHIAVNTNGAAFLWNSATGIVGATSTGYSSTAATMVTNLLGAAGGAPRIAPYWRDLNFLAANNGGVWINNTLPGKCVITWANAVHYSNNPPIFTFQAQLFDTGEVRFFYSGSAQNYNTVPICGISQGGGIADPGVTDLSVGAVGTSTTPIVYQTFTASNTFDLQVTTVSFASNGLGGYDAIPAPCVPAANTNYGSGCYDVSATAYEVFPPTTIDLSNQKILLLPNMEGGYTFAQGFGTNFAHTQPGLALTDDSVATLALPIPFNYPGGSTTSLSICSNGYIWMQAPNTSADYTPTVAELFTNPARLCVMWCDAVPDGTTNINNVFAEVDPLTNIAYVTYAAVPVIGGGGVIDVQIEFNLVLSEIEIRYGTVSCTNNSLFGWTPGLGFSTVNGGNVDVTAALPTTFKTNATERLALALSAAPVPVLGNTLVYTTDNIPGSALFTGLLISLGAVDPGLPLGPIGAPGCHQYIDLNTAAVNILMGSPSIAFPFVIPNDAGFIGLPLCTQAAAFDLASNPLGVITSNGVRSVVNSF